MPENDVTQTQPFKERIKEVIQLLWDCADSWGPSDEDVSFLYEELRKRQIILTDLSKLMEPARDDTVFLSETLHFLQQGQDHQ